MWAVTGGWPAPHAAMRSGGLSADPGLPVSRTLPGPRRHLHDRGGQEVRPPGQWWGQPSSPKFQLGLPASPRPPSRRGKPPALLLGPACPSRAGPSFLVTVPALKRGGHPRPRHGFNSTGHMLPPTPRGLLCGSPHPPGTAPWQHLQRESGANTGCTVPALLCAGGSQPRPRRQA